MRNGRIPFVLFFLLPIALHAQLYKTYEAPRRWAATFELGSISPGVSANIEYAPIQTQRSFVVLRAGIGHTITSPRLVTVPHAITWNILLNGRKKGCPPLLASKPLFVELGLGGVYFIKSNARINYGWSPIAGLRGYFPVNLRSTGFWKLQGNLLIIDRVIPWGGVGIGIMLD